MANNKNQHYVPKCYLKAFTLDSDGKAINVYNIDRKKLIPLAPVKNQCSRDYFYGKDEKLEDAIQFLEQSYGIALSELLQTPTKFCEHHKIVLKRFWLFQYLRTEASSLRAMEMSEGIGKYAGLSAEEFNLGIKDAVNISMHNYAECMQIVDDLKVCLIKNHTDLPFITSDDPAVLSNRWHLNDVRAKYFSFGLKASGNLLFLPLTPQLMCLAYDGDIYSIKHKKGWIEIRNKNDVKYFNEHQILNCRANLFLKEKRHAAFLHESYEAIQSSRNPVRHKMNYAIFDRAEGEYKRYKCIEFNEENAQKYEDVIIHSETIHHQPTSWPSIIQWRDRGSVYTDGSRAGYVRRPFTKNTGSKFYKEAIRTTKFV
ncbi:hypothetical protein SOPP22_12150 [Shewanella sp. OPT22]|nr:hypothetical protein SOPP22_12150 [Shewanella sp. OPT22]